jgi:hypothetical protein
MIYLDIDFNIKKQQHFLLAFVLFFFNSLYSNSSTIFITSNTVFVNKSENSLDKKYINPLSTNIIYVEENTITTNLERTINGAIVYNCKKTNQKVKILGKKEKLTSKEDYKSTVILKKPIGNDKLFVTNKLNNLTIPSSNEKTNEKTNGIINENHKINSFLLNLQYSSLLNQIYLINLKRNNLKVIFRLRAPPLI